MNCFVHDRAAVGLCVLCQKAVCRDCVGREAPRLICRQCDERGAAIGFEYRSKVEIAGWPLVHLTGGLDPVTLRPRVARGIIAIGNIAIGVFAVGGLAVGLVTFGGASLGLLFALGGAAIGVGVSIGGLAVGSFALGGAAVGFSYAIGGAAFGPATIDGTHCDPAVVEFLRRWLGVASVPGNC
jgi:hypothetical protein